MPDLQQIQQKIEQLGGVEEPSDFKRSPGKQAASYILDGEVPV